MPEIAPPVAFTLSYVRTLDDIAELADIEWRKKRRRVHSRLASALVAFALVIVVMMGIASSDPDGRIPGLPVLCLIMGWTWAYLWMSGAALFRLSSRRHARRRRDTDLLLSSRWDVQVSELGFASRTDVSTESLAWAAITAIRETERQFLLMGPGGDVLFALPKHGLADPAQVDVLRGYLYAHAGRVPSAAG